MTSENRGNRKASSRTAIAVSIAAATILALTGCNAIGSVIPGASNPAATAAAAAKPGGYGSAVGTGAIIGAPGSQYEKIAVSPAVLAIKPGPGELAGDGWTTDQKLEARNMAMKYTVEEFLDSNVLEGGEPALTEWKAKEGKAYMAPDFQYTGVMALLGNVGGHKSIPAMIHDGKPRVAKVSLTPSFGGASNENGVPTLTYAVHYEAEYRVNDANAAYSGGLENNMSPEQFIASDKAKDALKDNQGENILGAYGQLELTMKYAADGLKVSQTNFRVDFDTSDFSKAPVSPRK